MGRQPYVAIDVQWRVDRILYVAACLTFVCVFAFGTVGFLGQPAPAWLGDLGDAALESDAGGHTMLSMRAAYAALQEAEYSVTCSGVDYAYCGMATCRLNGDGRTASCGCKRERDATGRLFFKANSAYMVYSRIVRRALYEKIVTGRDHKFRDLVCDAVADAELWSDAGFDVGYGSFADPDGAHWPQHDIGCSESGDFHLADCEGAPCDFKAFDDIYEATCTCPYVTATMAATESVKKIRRSTAKSCREVSPPHGDCALQETLEPGELIDSYENMTVLHDYIAKAKFRTGGTECKTFDDYSYSY